MKTVDFLQKTQQISTKILENCLKSNKFFQGYLFSGSLGTPLLDIAKLFAKSMLCKNHNPYACDHCDTCYQFDRGTLPNIVILDTTKEEVKKETITELMENFSKTSSSTNEIRVYIINQIENLSTIVSNALLKFLEEPPANVYAICTTLNKFKILPTILSRLEKIEFSLLDQNYLIDEAKKLGVESEDAELLSFFYNNPDSILEASKNKRYIESKKDLLELFNNIDNKYNLRFYIENKIITKLTSNKENAKEEIRYFFDNLTIFIKEAYKYSINGETTLKSYDKIIKDIANNVPNLELAVLETSNGRNELSSNLNQSLLILHTLSKIFGV